MKKLSLLLLILVSLSANADLKQDSINLCQKIKSCALSELVGQQVSPNEREGVANFFDVQCVQSIQKYETPLANAGLEDKKAKACLVSLTNSSCNSLLSGSRSGPLTTPECVDFANEAKSVGIEVAF